MVSRKLMHFAGLMTVFVGVVIMGSLQCYAGYDFEIGSGNASVIDNTIVLDSGTTLWFTDVYAEGDYAIEFTLDLSRDSSEGVSVNFNATQDKLGGISFAIMTHEMIQLGYGGIALMRGFPRISPVQRNVKVRIEVYASSNVIVYYLDDKMYGERFLVGPDDPELTGGMIGLSAARGVGKASFRDFGIFQVDEPLKPSPILEKPVLIDRPYDSAYPRANPPADTIIYVNIDELPADEQFTIVALQGLVNRTVPRIYTSFSHYEGWEMHEDWLKVLTNKGHVTKKSNSTKGMIAEFVHEIDGVILTNSLSPLWPDEQVDFEINVVTTLSGILNAIPMTESFYNSIKKTVDLPVVFDARGRWKSSVEAYRWVYENYWHKCNHFAISHIQPVPYTIAMRDYLIQNRVFTFFSSDVVTRDDYYFYLNLLASTAPNTPIMGVTTLDRAGGPPGVFDEDCLFRLAAELGKFYLYTHSAANLSVHSGIQVGNLKQKQITEPVQLEDDKIYVALMTSEGENLTWFMYLTNNTWGDVAHTQVPNGWSTPLAVADLIPGIIEYYYDTASVNDYFFADGGGIGDIYNLGIYGIRYPREYRNAMVDEYLALTKNAMQKLDICILRAFDATYRISDDTVRLYVDGIPSLNAIYTGYNGEPGGVTHWDANKMINEVPLFRTLAGSSGPTYETNIDGDVLIKNIKRAAPGTRNRPGFMNVFVLGNYVLFNSEVLKYVQDNLGEEFVIVRPDELARLYSEYHSQR